MNEYTIQIEGMSCQHCVASVRKALAQLPGVEVRSVDIGTAVVGLDESRVPLEVVTAAIREAGYQPLP